MAENATNTELSQREADIIAHALGISSTNKRSYRNHFVTDPASDDGGTCRALVARGLMKDGGATLDSEMHCYRVTRAGTAAIRLRH